VRTERTADRQDAKARAEVAALAAEGKGFLGEGLPPVTLADRRAAFERAFPQQAASWPWLTREQGRDVLYGVWVIGADYRHRTPFYGAYPKGFLDRVMALFPDVVALQDKTAILHVFSGSLPAGMYERCDSHQDAELRCSVYDLPNVILNWRPRLVIADPPYSSKDAEQYGTPPVHRHRATQALAAVVNPGGHLAWLDVCWPMHNKTQWVTVGRILVQRSTNHRARVLSIFERVAA
jgi:hypothetical protein